MALKIIKTQKEYNEALARIDVLIDAVPGSAQEEELELITLLVEKYEEDHFPIDTPDPVETIKFRMEQEGLEPKDLIPVP
jgi:HTH-type transcriptional regulator/antitoxin HigA